MSANAGKARLQFLRENEARRQTILDYLNANGPTLAHGLHHLIDMPVRQLRSTLQTMRQRGEVAITGSHKKTLYIALKTITESAEKLHTAIQTSRLKKRGSEYKKPDAPEAPKITHHGSTFTSPASIQYPTRAARARCGALRSSTASRIIKGPPCQT